MVSQHFIEKSTLNINRAFLIYTLKREKPIERFRNSGFVLMSYGFAIFG
jgi:hypothetical protein